MPDLRKSNQIRQCECGTWLDNGRDANGTKHRCPLKENHE